MWLGLNSGEFILERGDVLPELNEAVACLFYKKLLLDPMVLDNL